MYGVRSSPIGDLWCSHMKGLVFTEFLEMVEDAYGWEMAEDIIEAARLASGGAYTATGTYPHEEMVALAHALSHATDTPVPELFKVYGQHLFGRFLVLYPAFFENIESTMAFVTTIHDHIHVEVRKLYPDAELPHFSYQRASPDTLTMTYRSTRPFADFAEGLIQGCMAHFGDDVTMQRHDLSDAGNATEFHFATQTSHE